MSTETKMMRESVQRDEEDRLVALIDEGLNSPPGDLEKHLAELRARIERARFNRAPSHRQA